MISICCPGIGSLALRMAARKIHAASRKRYASIGAGYLPGV